MEQISLTASDLIAIAKQLEYLEKGNLVISSFEYFGFQISIKINESQMDGRSIIVTNINKVDRKGPPIGGTISI